MHTAVSDARKRMLPAIIQQQYNDAKTAFDHDEFAVAARGFEQVVAALNDSDLAPVAAQPPLSDLRTLAAGFRELSVKAIPPPPPRPPVAPPPAANQPPRIYAGDEAWWLRSSFARICRNLSGRLGRVESGASSRW